MRLWVSVRDAGLIVLAATTPYVGATIVTPSLAVPLLWPAGLSTSARTTLSTCSPATTGLASLRCVARSWKVSLTVVAASWGMKPVWTTCTWVTEASCAGVSAVAAAIVIGGSVVAPRVRTTWVPVAPVGTVIESIECRSKVSKVWEAPTASVTESSRTLPRLSLVAVRVAVTRGNRSGFVPACGTPTCAWSKAFWVVTLTGRSRIVIWASDVDV